MTLSLALLWEVCWRATALLTAMLFSAVLLRRRLLLRQAVLHLGLVMLLLLPATMLLPRIHWTVLPAEEDAIPQVAAAGAVRHASPTVQRRMLPAGQVLAEPSRTERPAQLAANVDRASLIPAPSESKPTQPLLLGNTQATPSSTHIAITQPAVRFWTLTSAGIALYLLGCLLLLSNFLRGLWQLRRLTASSTLIEDPAWCADLDACCLNQRITCSVALRSSTHVSTPLTYGWWRPVLIVPEVVAQRCTLAERRAILLHELIHIQRRDFAWICVLQVVRALYWCHPVTWVFARVFSATQEEVCDAICVGEFGTQRYAEALVSVARTAQRPVVLTLGLAMSRTSRLSQRLVRIQQQGGLLMSRLSHRGLCAAIALAFPIGLATLLVQPVRAQVEAPAKAVVPVSGPAAAAPNVNKVAAPAPSDAAPPHVLLQLVDEHGEPLMSTTLRLRRMREINNRMEFDEQWTELTSHSTGLVRVPLTDIQPDDSQVGLDIEVAGRAPHMDGFPILRTTGPNEPMKVKLRPAVTLTTRVFDADGSPVPNARFTVKADVDVDSHYQTWEILRTTDSEGRVELHVPLNAVFGLIVTSDRGAPYRLVCPAGTEKLSDIHLPRGCVVAGQLLDRNGKPVPNCNVVLEREDSQAVSTEFEVKRHGGGSLDLQFERRTDAEGRFRFYPMEGDVRVYLDCNSKQPVPMIIPLTFKLPETGEKWLPLMLAPTGQISGTVRWPDGKPVPKMEIGLEIPPHLSNAYVNLSNTRTDADGKYSLTVPFPLEQGFLTGSASKGPDGEYWDAAPKVATPGNPHTDWHPVERYLGESRTVDWVMVPREKSRSSKAPALADVDVAWQPLANLELEIEAAQKAYQKAVDGDAQDKLDPRYVMVDRCLAFEAEHRGNRLGIGALYYVMRAAATAVNTKVNSARTKAIEILDKHYLAHPDLDLLISDFDAGSGDPTAEPFLRHLIEQSPFDYVRAAALFQLAEARFDFLHLAENIYNTPLQSEAEYEAMLKIQTNESAREWVRNQRAEAVRFHEAVKGVDLAQLRQEALQLLDRTVNNYTGVKAPQRHWVSASGIEDAFELKLTEWAGTDWRIRTIAERADILRFQQTRLQNGTSAPEIEGFDYHQRPIRLSQFKGKVVLLAVGVGPSEEELSGNMTKLSANLKDKPVQCVSVVPGSGDGGWSVRAIVEDTKITWPIIRDTTDDEVQARWCQQTFPEVYIIDQQGVIRHHFMGNHVSEEHLESLIRELLKVKGPM